MSFARAHIARFCSEDSGSSLVYVMFVISLLTATATVILIMNGASDILAVSILDEEQTMFAAEAGVMRTIDHMLIGATPWQGETEFEWEDYPVRTSTELFGVYYLIRSNTSSSKHACSTRAFVGSVRNEFDSVAVFLTGPEKRLFVTGDTEITGELHFRGGSVERGSIDGRTFRGTLVGDVTRARLSKCLISQHFFRR